LFCNLHLPPLALIALLGLIVLVVVVVVVVGCVRLGIDRRACLPACLLLEWLPRWAPPPPAIGLKWMTKKIPRKC